jgi:hypothetical protein
MVEDLLSDVVELLISPVALFVNFDEKSMEDLRVQGASAAAAGFSRESCPYGPGAARNSWLEGFGG